MEIQIKAYAYTIDIITEIRYFCKCNNAVFGKFRIIFTCAISKTDSSLHRNSYALFRISGNGKFVRTAVLPPHPSRNLRKSTPRPRPALNLPPLSKEGGLTARHKLLIYCVCLQYIRLFILQAFLPSRRRDCHATLACINPSKTALSFEKHYILARPRKRVRFCCSVKPSQLWWGLLMP